MQVILRLTIITSVPLTVGRSIYNAIVIHTDAEGT